MQRIYLASLVLLLSACGSNSRPDKPTDESQTCVTNDGTENKSLSSASTTNLRTASATSSVRAMTASAPRMRSMSVAAPAVRAMGGESAPIKANYQAMFDVAYKQYPSIAKGTLEALAYTQTGWEHVNPSHDHNNTELDDIHMPRAYGIMGLYHGDMFMDQVGAAAKLLGTTNDQIILDAQTNILAAAALIDAKIQKMGGAQKGNFSQLAEALKQYAGFEEQVRFDRPVNNRNTDVDKYVKDYFSYEILSAMANGVDDNGIKIPQQIIDLKSVFRPKRLMAMRSSFATLSRSSVTTSNDVNIFDVDNEKFLSRQSTVEKGNSSSTNRAPRMMMRSAAISNTAISHAGKDYSEALWKPSTEFSPRKDSVKEVIIHTCEGSYTGCVSWLRKSKKTASGKRIYSSAHYVVSKSGQVAQLVNESQKAWHAKSHNPYAIGIEHEGFAKKPNQYTESQYEASARLVRYLCDKYASIDCLTARKESQTNPKFGPVMGADVSIKGHQHASGNNHVDPGVYWDWPKYYALINPGVDMDSLPLPDDTTYPRTPSGYKVLDNFQYSLVHFTAKPTFSSTTKGISESSLIERSCDVSHDDNCSMWVRLEDDPNDSGDWSVRLLSGKGDPTSNATLFNNGKGSIGFWINSNGNDLKVSVSIDDNDGTERAVYKSIPSCGWTYVEWKFSDDNDWNEWIQGDGRISASEVRLDAIFIERAASAEPVDIYIDRVLHKYK